MSDPLCHSSATGSDIDWTAKPAVRSRRETDRRECPDPVSPLAPSITAPLGSSGEGLPLKPNLLNPAWLPAAPESAPTLSRPSEPSHESWCDSQGEGWGPDARLPPRQRVGDYELLQELGRGGMGVVYKAVHVTLKRVVALKMIRSGRHADAEELKRFQLEAEAVARLQHPNIVQIYEVGEHKSCPYFALEYVEGASLDRVLGHTPQPPRQAAILVVTLARAVHAAHLAQVVHRDLKPANILLQNAECGMRNAELQPKGAAGSDRGLGSEFRIPHSAFRIGSIPKITDFGLAKQLDDDSGQTQTGLILGTPCYMAPEQAAGRIKEIGIPTDVWALAAILYECLTGRPPFKGGSPRATIEQVRCQEPVPPRRLEPGTPRDLETICLKGLQKNPRHRYASAAALAEDLQRWLEGRPILARPASGWERVIKWARRQPALAGLMVAAALLIGTAAVGGVFYGLYQNAQAAALERQLAREKRFEQQRDRGRRAFDQGNYAEARLEWDLALEQLEDEDERRTPLTELRDQAATREKQQRQRTESQATLRALSVKEANYLGHREQVLRHILTVFPEDTASNHARIRQEAPAALEALGLDLAKPSLEAHVALHPEKSRFERFVGGVCQTLLAWTEAEAAPERPEAERLAGLKRALELLASADALTRAHGFVVPREHHLRRAEVLTRLGRIDEADAERKRAAAIREETSQDHFLAALSAYRRGEYVVALRACERVLGGESDHAFWAQYLRGLCYLHARNWGMARVALDACLAQRPDCRWALLQRATALVGEKDFDAAEKDFAAVLKATRAEDRNFRAQTLASRGAARILRQDWQRGIADLKRAVALRRDFYQAHVTLAQAYRWSGDLDGALRALRTALDDNPRDGRLHYTRAELHVRLGNIAAARRDYANAIANLSRGTSASLRASAHVQLGYLEHQAGAYEAALKHFAAALEEVEDFPDAHRQRAETLLCLGRDDEAARALDAYLRKGKPLAVIYRTRGLLHDRRGEYTQARGAYEKALELEKDATTYTLLGWVHLKAKAPRYAVSAFDAALKQEDKNADALCGRARALACLGEMSAAVRDAEAALKAGPASPRLLFHAACVHAVAFTRLQEAGRNSRLPLDRLRERERTLEMERARDRTLGLLREALTRVEGTAGKKAFWRDHVCQEPSLAPFRRSADLSELARKYAD